MATTLIQVRNPEPLQANLWRTAQVLGMVGTVVLLVGLVVRPELSLRLLWDVTIPLLPLVFLANPMVWRNVCPLATVGKLTGDRRGTNALPSEWTAAATAVGISLLFILVPARRFLFNENGIALAVTIAVVAVLAGVLGLFFSAKAGFCNAICPVLSVERLYGQRPLASISNARCEPCTMCTKRGCIDLSPEKSVAQTVGPLRKTSRWLTTPFGAFAAAFPGFIYAYNTLDDGPLSSALSVYGHFLMWCAISFAVVAAFTLIRRGHNERTVLFLGALSIGLYYWYAAPTIIEGVALPAAVAVPFRALAFALVLFWLWRALKTA